MKREKTPIELAAEALVLGKATKEQAVMYYHHYPEFQCCGRQVDVYIPQRNKTVPMILLYEIALDRWVAAVKTCGVIVAYEVAFNSQDARFVAYHRITKPI